MVSQLSIFLLLYVIVSTLLSGSESELRFPAVIYPDLGRSVRITASQTCNRNGIGYSCNSNTCPSSSRTSMTPTVEITSPSECQIPPADLPSHVSLNSYMYINSSLISKCNINNSFSIGNSEFSLSLWIKQTCITCDILELAIPESLKLYLSGNNIYFNTPSSSFSAYLSKGNWHHILIRKTAFFINGTKNVSMSLPPITSPPILEIKPGGFSSNYLSLAGIKLFDHRITDREVQLLMNGILPPRFETECRCPNDYPRLSDTYDPQGILCMKDIGTETISRLNTLSHIAGFANDGNTSTSWISGQTDNAVLTLYLDNVVQIKNLTVTLGTKPEQTMINMSFPGHSRTFSFSSVIKNNQLKIDLATELLAVSNRTQLEDTLAERIDITFSGHSDNETYFEVSEIDIMGRCNCYGNSDRCVRLSGMRKLTCQNCNINSSTTGSSCETCKKNHYRQIDELVCSKKCLCNSEGINSSDVEICEQVGGQCPCKKNVEGRTCTDCKHLTYNFNGTNIDGCMDCACDKYGSRSCNHTTGACVCKKNYKEDILNCSMCKPEFYGRHLNDGCVNCKCDTKGTLNSNKNCDESNGYCFCKPYVRGRTCDTCRDGYNSLALINSDGCDPCECNIVGSANQTCDKISGRCYCRDDIQGDKSCNPKIDRVYPEYGPVFGGTVVEVTGTLFGKNASFVDVFYRYSSNTTAFTLISVNDTRLVLQTQQLHQVSKGEILIVWKNTLKTTGVPNYKDKRITHPFEMRPNPKVTKTESIKSFKSFTCGVSIKGSNLDSVSEPKLIVVFSNGKRQEKVCNKLSGTDLKCGVPDLTSAKDGETLSYELVLDGLQVNFTNATIRVIKDPIIKPLEDGVTEFRNLFMKTITIKGSGFKDACSESDFQVKIGDQNCPIINITNTEIICEPEFKFPGFDATKELRLFIGEKSYEVGKVNMVMFWSTIEFIGIAVGAGVFLLIVITLIVVIKCCCCRKDKKQKSFDNINAGSVENNPILTTFHIPLNNLENSSCNGYENPCGVELEQIKNEQRVENRYTPMIIPREGRPSESENNSNASEEFLQKLDSAVRSQLELSLIKKTDVEVEKRCSKRGTNIRIIDGKYCDRKTTMKTLVRTLPSLNTSERFYKLMPSGLTECLKLRDCFHDNILQIYGFSVDQDRFYIVYPTTKRILKDHLNDKGQKFDVIDLVRMCKEVGEGMVFLDSENIVHKDIATRNCFVTDDGMVKICDASFAWDLFPQEYMYDSKKERYIPVRWMAPECLQYSFYDKKTDVWSFGILMWEMMSRSMGLPYWDVKDDEKISNHVTDGNRLGRPTSAPENMYQLMLNCWQHDSNYRPSMNSIVDQLVKIEEPQDFESSGLYQNLEHGTIGAPPSLPPRSDQLYGNIP